MFFAGYKRSKLSEQEIRDEYNLTSYKAIRPSILFGLLFFNGFAIYDYFFFPDHFIEHTTIRLGLVTPICLAAVMLLSKQKYRTYTRQIVLIGATLLGVCTIYFYKNIYPIAKDTTPAGLIFAFMYVLTSMRMLRREAFAFIAITATCVAIVLLHCNADAPSWFSYTFNLSLTYALGLVACTSIEQSWRKMVEQKKIVEHQEAEAARLLESVFPISIANRLRKNSGAIAERCDHASILFADIQGFTAAASQLSPSELVNDLNIVFSQIDDLCAQHGCEKIKTIGDSYLAVCGVTSPTPDHAPRIVKLALAMQGLSKDLTIGGQPVTLRIGIHSGPVVAGVIGKSRFAYDLWGDSVNMASRMESIAPPGQIQISTDTARLLGDDFVLTPRGKIQIKGKGGVDTWLVVGESTTQRQAA